MQRGPKPKPSNLRLLHGTASRRGRKAEPKPTPAKLAVPRFLNAEARAEWRRLVPELYTLGLVTSLDRAVLVAYVEAWATMRQAQAALDRMAVLDPTTKGLVIKMPSGAYCPNPLLGTISRARLALLRAGEQLGLSPAARTRIEAQPLTATDDERIDAATYMR